MSDVADLVRRRSDAALKRIIAARPRKCPSCGAVLGPIMPLLDSTGLVIGVGVECAGSSCRLGGERGLLFVPDPGAAR